MQQNERALYSVTDRRTISTALLAVFLSLQVLVPKTAQASRLQSLFSVSETEAKQITADLPAPILDTPYKLKLNVVALASSNWNAQNIHETLARMIQVWHQCGLEFTDIQVSTLDTQARYSKISDGEELKILKLSGMDSRPTVFLVHDFDQYHPDGEPLTAYAFRELMDFPRKMEALKGSIWISDIVLTKEYLNQREENYSTLAHELGHVILNLGHISSRNLMGATSKLVNSSLTHNQCRRLRLGSYVYE